MEQRQKRINQILADFKSEKLTAQKIELALKFSNGLLGKAAKGKCNLSDEKMVILEDYYLNNFKPKNKIENLTFVEPSGEKIVVKDLNKQTQKIVPVTDPKPTSNIVINTTPKKPFMNDAIKKKLGL